MRQGPAEILRKVSTNTYLLNLNAEEVILLVGGLKPYTPGRYGVNPPPFINHFSVRLSKMTPLLSRISGTMSMAVRFQGKQGGPNSPSRAANAGEESNTMVLTDPNGMMSLLSCMTSIETGWPTISSTTSWC